MSVVTSNNSRNIHGVASVQTRNRDHGGAGLTVDGATPLPVTTGLAVHLDFNDISTITVHDAPNNDKLKKIICKATGTAWDSDPHGTAPEWGSSKVASNQYLADFDSTEYSVAKATTVADILDASGEDFTAVVMGRLNANVAAGIGVDTEPCWLGTDDGAANEFSLIWNQTGSPVATHYIGVNANNGANGGADNVLSVPNPSPYYVAWWRGDQANSKFEYTVHDVTVEDAVHAAQVDTSDVLRLGKNTWEGRLGEVIIYNRLLTAGELTSVIEYLVTKWNPTIAS